MILFDIPAESMIDLEVYNVTGKLVQTLVSNGRYRAGEHQLFWDANDLPNGAYLIKLRYNNELVTCRSILMR